MKLFMIMKYCLVESVYEVTETIRNKQIYYGKV